MKNSIKMLAVIIMVIITSMSNTFGQYSLVVYNNGVPKSIILKTVDQPCIDNLREFQDANDEIDNPVDNPVNNESFKYAIQYNTDDPISVDNVVKIEGDCAVEDVYNFIYIVNGHESNFYIKTNLTVGLNDVNVSNLTLYPNPVMNVLNINFDATEDVNVTLMDMSGRVLYTETTSMLTSVDMSDQPSGMYLVKVGNVTQRVIKQ